MVALLLGDERYPGGEAEGVPEVAELEPAPDPLVGLPFPGGVNEGVQVGRLLFGHGDGARPAGLAVLLGQLRGRHVRGIARGAADPAVVSRAGATGAVPGRALPSAGPSASPACRGTVPRTIPQAVPGSGGAPTGWGRHLRNRDERGP